MRNLAVVICSVAADHTRKRHQSRVEWLVVLLAFVVVGCGGGDTQAAVDAAVATAIAEIPVANDSGVNPTAGTAAPTPGEPTVSVPTTSPTAAPTAVPTATPTPDPTSTPLPASIPTPPPRSLSPTARALLIEREINDRRVEALMDVGDGVIGPVTHWLRDIGDDGYPIYWIDTEGSLDAASQLSILESSIEYIASKVEVFDLLMQVDADTDDIPLDLIRIRSESFDALCPRADLLAGNTSCIANGRQDADLVEWTTWLVYDVLEHEILRDSSIFASSETDGVEGFVRLEAKTRSLVISFDLVDGRMDEGFEQSFVGGLYEGMAALVDAVNAEVPTEMAVQNVQLRGETTYVSCSVDELAANDQSCLEPPPVAAPTTLPRDVEQTDIAIRAILTVADMPQGYTIDLDEPVSADPPTELCPGVARPNFSHPGTARAEAEFSAAAFGPYAGLTLEGFATQQDARIAFDVRRDAYAACPDGYFSGSSGGFVDATVTEVSTGALGSERGVFAYRFESTALENFNAVWVLEGRWIVSSTSATSGFGSGETLSPFDLVEQQVERLLEVLEGE